MKETSTAGAPADRLRGITTFHQLVRYLHDELDWPIESESFEDLTFDYEPSELGLDPGTAAKVRKIKQLRPLSAGQPWGIFFIDFEPKRLPVVALRRILSHLVVKKRQTATAAHRASWELHDLLFISSYGEDAHRNLAFAHFAEDQESMGDLPVLKVLDWDDEDTVAHLEYSERTLKEKLRWPDDETNLDAWRKGWSAAFTLKPREVITTAKRLSIEMADLARRIRRRVNTVLRIETDRGPMRRLMTAFKEALIHDLSADDFADMYAQTVTYGLLAARVSRPAGLVADNLADMVPVTNPFLRDLLSTFLKVGGRKAQGSGGVDFDELGINEVVQALRDAAMDAVLRDFDDKNPREDPVIHFYELFLKEYDPNKRMKRGVFYTPRPAVSFIVRSVDELLRTEFGLEDGLADTTTWGEMARRHIDLKLPEGAKPEDSFVCVLDPATGTGTFLVEVINIVHQTMLAKWRAQRLSDEAIRRKWNEYVADHLLPRLYGFELLMAPYAIAHMKIGLKLAQTGYAFAEHERVRVYLTNSLEPPQDFSDRLEFDVPALAHEAQAVNAVKRNRRFTVVIGNPPYSLTSANMEPGHRALVERYKLIGGERLLERGALQLEKILNDDYVKFIALTQNCLSASGTGISGLITNHAYLDNPTMRGLRHSFLTSSRQAYFYDLGGSTKKAGESTDENVFDIQQGVAICVAVTSDRRSDPNWRHARLVGMRETKYELLGEASISSTTWSELAPSPPYYLFVPTDYGLRSEYELFVPLGDVFPLHSIGCFTSKDHFVISREPQVLIANAKAFRDSRLADRELCKSFEMNPKEAWDVSRSRDQIRQLSDHDIGTYVLRFTHRPFDSKYIFYHRSLVWSLAYPVNRNLMKKGNLALVTSRQLATPPWRHVFCANAVVEMLLMSNKTKEGNHVFPLYVLPDESGIQRRITEEEVRPNLGNAVLDLLSARLLSPRGEMGLPGGLTAEDVFYYAYSVFHSPGYRSRYAEFLKIDFPRLPLPGNLDLFQGLTRLGGELVALHLMESPRLEHSMTAYIGPKSPEVRRVAWSDGTVWLDAAATKKGQPATAGTIGFRGVPEEVWNFHIGGYQVCEKWLKDRKGRTLSKDDIAHYQKIVVALNETIRLMGEIDEVIDTHGGWPSAFVAGREG